MHILRFQDGTEASAARHGWQVAAVRAAKRIAKRKGRAVEVWWSNDANDEDARTVPQADGGSAEAWVYEMGAATSEQARAWVNEIHAMGEDDEAEDDA